jgi:glycosyltransferase involved in cell wall biosynthesis
MSFTDQITPMILTYNEEPNIGRVLARLTFAKRILVIDSYSADSTLDICRSFPNVHIVQRKFDSFAEQCNFGLTHVTSEWVLSMDADYILSDVLISELQTLAPDPTTHGFYVPFKYCIFGKPLRATLLPPRCSLYRRTSGQYENDGHAHRVVIDGRTGMLKGHLHHDDRKSLSRWIASQDRYTEKEVQKLLSTPREKLSRNDRLRRMKWVAPLAVPFMCLVVHRGLLDGWAGWYYAMQRTLAEMLLALRLIEEDGGFGNSKGTRH